VISFQYMAMTAALLVARLVRPVYGIAVPTSSRLRRV